VDKSETISLDELNTSIGITYDETTQINAQRLHDKYSAQCADDAELQAWLAAQITAYRAKRQQGRAAYLKSYAKYSLELLDADAVRALCYYCVLCCCCVCLRLCSHILMSNLINVPMANCFQSTNNRMASSTLTSLCAWCRGHASLAKRWKAALTKRCSPFKRTRKTSSVARKPFERTTQATARRAAAAVAAVAVVSSCNSMAGCCCCCCRCCDASHRGDSGGAHSESEYSQ
jgi:hypothetical protein